MRWILIVKQSVLLYMDDTDTAFDNQSSDEAIDHSQEGQEQSCTVFMPDKSTTVLSTDTPTTDVNGM